ncbi:MAG: hypothetical protein AAFR75_04435 [Pseudomonadota bacterium]
MKVYRTCLIISAIAVASTFPAHADRTGMADMHDQRREGSKICLSGHFHTGTGKGRSKRAAKADAIKAWQEFTAWEYGLDWAYFIRAKSKSVGYERAAEGWEATVEARPCRRR